MAEAKGCGEYDIYVELAFRFNWTHEQIESMDPHVIDELICRMNAEDKFQKKNQPKKNQPKKNQRRKLL